MNAPDRRAFIGGSDAAAILGVSPWHTPLDLYLIKTGQKPEFVDPARARLFKRGKRLEPVVVDMLAEEYGIAVTKRSTPEEPNRYKDEEHPMLAAEIDFEWRVTPQAIMTFGLPENLLGTIQNGEVKTVHPFASAKFGDVDTDEVPVEYAAQAMHGLAVTGRDLCMFGVLVGADNLGVYWIRRDEETVAGMRAQELAFWRDHIEPRVPPAPQNLPDVAMLFGKGPAASLEATAEIAALVDELALVKQSIAAAGDRETEIKFEIGKYLLGAGGILLANGGRLEATPATMPGKHVLTKAGAPLLSVALQTQSRIDNDRLRAEHPEIAAACLKQSSFIRFDQPRKRK